MDAKAAKTSRFRSTWNPGACTCQFFAENYENAFALCCNLETYLIDHHLIQVTYTIVAICLSESDKKEESFGWF